MQENSGKRNPSDQTGGINGLGAEGPTPGMEEELATFGQFVGDWEIVEDRYLEEDGSWTKQRGELHWGWILGGRALQDVWMSIDERTQRPGAGVYSEPMFRIRFESC